MTAYNILEARNNLSRLIASVESGVEVTITRRGVPVARLVPVVDPKSEQWTGASLVAWLEANPLPESTRRTTEEIEAGIREAREAWD